MCNYPFNDHPEELNRALGLSDAQEFDKRESETQQPVEETKAVAIEELVDLPNQTFEPEQLPQEPKTEAMLEQPTPNPVGQPTDLGPLFLELSRMSTDIGVMIAGLKEQIREQMREQVKEQQRYTDQRISELENYVGGVVAGIQTELAKKMDNSKTTPSWGLLTDLPRKVSEVIASTGTVAKNQKILNDCQNSIAQAVSEIKTTLRNANTNASSAAKEQLDQIAMMSKQIGDIHYNTMMGSGSTTGSVDAEYVSRLQQQVVSLQEDTFLKMMRNYIIDTYVDLYTQISKRILEITGDGEDELKKILSILEDEMQNIGIALQRSRSGVKFDPKFMIPNSEYSNPAETPEQKYTVYCSITPGFVWTIPTVGSTKTEMLLRKEEVALNI